MDALRETNAVLSSTRGAAGILWSRRSVKGRTWMLSHHTKDRCLSLFGLSGRHLSKLLCWVIPSQPRISAHLLGLLDVLRLFGQHEDDSNLPLPYLRLHFGSTISTVRSCTGPSSCNPWLYALTIIRKSGHCLDITPFPFPSDFPAPSSPPNSQILLTLQHYIFLFLFPFPLYPLSSILFALSSVLYPLSSILYPQSSVLHLLSFNIYYFIPLSLCPYPFIHCPLSFILHPCPFPCPDADLHCRELVVLLAFSSKSSQTVSLCLVRAQFP